MAMDDNYKLKSGLRALVNVVKNAVITAWWLIAIGGTAALWFYPVGENRLQPILFATAAALYALLSKALYKVKEVEASNEL